MKHRTHYENLDAMTIMDFARDDLKKLRDAVDSTITVTSGLLAGDLQYDTRSALMVAELVGGLREKVEDCMAEIALSLMHAEGPPSRTAIARAVGISMTKLSSIAAHSEPVTQGEDAD